MESFGAGSCSWSLQGVVKLCGLVCRMPAAAFPTSDGGGFGEEFSLRKQ